MFVRFEVMSDIKVVKMGDMPTKKAAESPSKKKTAGVRHDKKPKFGILKGGKTARRKPRFEPVADPAKAPPISKNRKKTLRILTEKGVAHRRKKIADDVAKTPIGKIRQTLRKHGLPVKDSSPEKLVRKIYADAQEAGMVSSE